LAHVVAVGPVGADKAGQGDHPGIHEELGDLADATDVLVAILGGKAQVLVDAEADVVAVEAVGDLAHLVQGAFQGHRDGALAAAGETGKPEGRGFLVEQAVAVGAGDLAVVPVDVGGDLFGHGGFLWWLWGARQSGRQGTPRKYKSKSGFSCMIDHKIWLIAWSDPMKYTLRHLEVFLAVARHKNTTAAAEELHLSQSAVSAALLALEKSYDVRLFDRTGKKLELNQTGHALRKKAESLLAHAREFDLELARHQNI